MSEIIYSTPLSLPELRLIFQSLAYCIIKTGEQESESKKMGNRFLENQFLAQQLRLIDLFAKIKSDATQELFKELNDRFDKSTFIQCGVPEDRLLNIPYTTCESTNI